MLCRKAHAASWNVFGQPFQSWTVTTNPSWRCSAGKHALRAGTWPADLCSHGLLPRIHPGDALLESARCELERCRPTFPVMDCHHESIPEMLCLKARVASWNVAGRPFQSWTVTMNPFQRCPAGKLTPFGLYNIN